METTTLKNLRTSKRITQTEAAVLLGISLRSYKTYENDLSKSGTLKYKYLVQTLYEYNTIDEEHGILNLGDIKDLVDDVLCNYPISFCYLFGSYARDEATETSDVDLLIDTEITGLEFFGLIEKLRTRLCKKVDLLKINQLEGNQKLLRNILKDGIKIYG